MGRTQTAPPMHFKTMVQSDVPQGRNGKHKLIVTTILNDLDRLKGNSAVKGDHKETSERACPLMALKPEGSSVGVNRSELNYGKNQGFSDSRGEVQRRNYSSSGVFTSRAIADPSLVKSRTFQVSKISA